ncbi:hypothetical protein B1T48_16980 [Mycobacterium persicum]|nr:hypothetical protein B1T48_16980 [Mycobacterium persicum]
MSEQLELDLFEQWRPVVGYEGLYEVSDVGRVRSLARTVLHPHSGRYTLCGRILSPHPDGCGYLKVRLHRDGQGRTRKVHQLVLEAFVGPRPAGLECCHADDDKTNNRLSNLRYDTRSANMLDQVRNGRHRWARQAA